MRFVKYAVICAVATLLAGCRPALPTDEWAGMVAPTVLAESSLQYYWRCKIVSRRRAKRYAGSGGLTKISMH